MSDEPRFPGKYESWRGTAQTTCNILMWVCCVASAYGGLTGSMWPVAFGFSGVIICATGMFFFQRLHFRWSRSVWNSMCTARDKEWHLEERRKTEEWYQKIKSLYGKIMPEA